MHISIYKNGDKCPSCERGELSLVTAIPQHRSPGKSEMTFRCTQCDKTIISVQDNRFQG